MAKFCGNCGKETENGENYCRQCNAIVGTNNCLMKNKEQKGMKNHISGSFYGAFVSAPVQENKKNRLPLVFFLTMLVCITFVAGLILFLHSRLESEDNPSKPRVFQIVENKETNGGNCSDTIQWKIYKDGTLIIEGNGVMPDYYHEVPPWAEENLNPENEITNITIKNGIKRIGANAFKYCRFLTNVTIEDGVTDIGKRAFYQCRELINITVPDSVIMIDDEAFEGTAWMEEQPDGIIYAGKVACSFKGARSDAAELSFSPGTKGIAAHAFADYTNLTKVVIPESVEAIGSSAFHDCSFLSDVSIPEGIIRAGSGVFSGTKWYTAQPEGIIYLGKVAYDYKGTIPATLEIKEGTVSIGESCFYFKTGIDKVILPDSLQYIESAAFAHTGLSEIFIPVSVSWISDQAFYGCTYLRSITVSPQNQNYTDVNGVLFNKGETSLMQYPLGNEQKHYDVPTGVISICDSAFQYCKNLNSFTLPETLISIGEYAFEQCSALAETRIPASVTEIGWGAFCGLKTSGFNVDSQNRIFSNDSNGVLFDKDKTVLIQYPCEKGEETYQIPNGVIAISNRAFRNSKNLHSVSIPLTIKTIGEYAFDGCENLTDYYYAGTQDNWEQISIDDGTVHTSWEINPLKTATFHFGQQ